ncbi:hypothetical protein [Carboxylicivirga sp. N1Y90]|uniref:hypothetical protein n=1 Tax=Carboxylicivirga fragile TaxID=3417571 RepID=UPI003D32ACDD|nr:hypothetical protein [Marinilabiliaceae bacterium N1Y90]
MINTLKTNVQLHLKNLLGWKTNRKILVLAVDDYGNVRVDSKEARERMDQAGLEVPLRFDAYDAMENREDLEILYETLDSVKGKNGEHAKVTAFSVPCNIDYDRMVEEDYQEYRYELLPQTFKKLADRDDKAYSGTWDLWKKGMDEGYLMPQFHGREHISLKVLNEKLAKRDPEILTVLKNRSYTSISSTGYATIDWSAAFDFWKLEETLNFGPIIEDGLNAFEKVFGFRSVYFNAPGQPEHSSLHQHLHRNGIKYLDTPFIKNEHLGEGQFRKEINYIGKKNKLGMIYNIRNVLFEPCEDRGFDWVNYTLKQIEVAFRMKHPAVISSHRVNYCGHISVENRKKGLSDLKRLLKEVKKRWPDIEFMNSVELMDLVSQK